MPWYPLSSRIWRARLGWAALTRPRRGAFGPEQARRWAEFYLAEEREQRARGASEFARELARSGPPDCGNPLPNDDEGHFLIHPGGFIAGEFDRVLRPAGNELEAQRGEQALTRLGLLANWGCPMLSARTYWADDDLRFAMALSALEGRWELFGARAPRVVVNALRAGLLEVAVAGGLLIARRLSEERWHPAPWRRPEPEPAREPEPPAPALDLGSWRSRRAGGPAPAAASEPSEPS